MSSIIGKRDIHPFTRGWSYRRIGLQNPQNSICITTEIEERRISSYYLFFSSGATFSICRFWENKSKDWRGGSAVIQAKSFSNSTCNSGKAEEARMSPRRAMCFWA